MNNRSLWERAQKIIPGGVHSPVRSFKGLGCPPLFMTRGRGAYLIDEKGLEFIDFCMSFGPLIHGHAPEKVKKAASQALEWGWSYGTQEPYSLELAEWILEKLPFLEKIRFTSSGTEAVMTALRLARGMTKKDKIILFEGCYHGHGDTVLDCQGVCESFKKETIRLPLEDEKKVEEAFHLFKGQIAAVIIEPLPANHGLRPLKESFLHFLREITQEEGGLLIFDEVISGFRLGLGGMAQRLGIVPDLPHLRENHRRGPSCRGPGREGRNHGWSRP